MAIATKTRTADDTTVVAERKIEIDPGFTRVDHSGFVSNTIVARAPQEAAPDDIRDPQIWKAVQRSGTALKKFDKVSIVGWAEDWWIEALVVAADSTEATLHIHKVVNVAKLATPVWSDGTYRTAWIGNGFIVERIVDGQRCSEVFSSAAQAREAALRLYPKIVT